MYYHLCNSGGKTTYLEGVNRTSKSLIRGKEITEKEGKLPYIYTYDEPDHHPLKNILGEGSIPELKELFRETGEEHLWDFFDAQNIMSKKMYSVLQDCGIDNIQALPLQFVNKKTEKAREDYIVFNVLGMIPSVKVADALPEKEYYQFAGSLLDPQKTGDLLIFRKSPGNGLFIHETVANKLKEQDLKGISLIPTRVWKIEG